MAEKSRFKAIKCLSSHINFCLFFCQYDQEHSISLQGVFLKIFVEYKQLDFCSAYFVPGTAPYLRTHVGGGVCCVCVQITVTSAGSKQSPRESLITSGPIMDLFLSTG